MPKIKITLNNREIECKSGETILNVAKRHGIDIPSLCHHPEYKTKNHCNLCIVKIAGEKDLVRACETKVQAGQNISISSEEIGIARKNNLEAILKQHLFECDDCVWFKHCRLLELTKRFKALPFKEKNPQDNVIQVGSIIFDQTKCIGCGRCVHVCPTKFLSLDKREKVILSKKTDCTNCGQCILACPVGAIEAVGEFEELKNLLADKEKIKVAQFAPSIRTSLSEALNLPAGKIMTGQLVAGLKKLGFDYVFDTAVGADFTTSEEAVELIERLTSRKNLPAMSSCCPAWVKFLEFEFPEFIPNLCTSRSPQSILGGIIKKFWAPSINKRPQEIYLVSIMPCTAKKFEIKRQELGFDSIPIVDEVLTTRELLRLFGDQKIDLKTIASVPTDKPYGEPSGAGTIYGSSGGVFESALRTAYFNMTGKNLSANAVLPLRGQKSIKTMEINIDNKKIKVAVVNGLKNARKVLKQLKKTANLYDAVEVMACPVGCVGGGGQPMPVAKEKVKARSESLYQLDKKIQQKSAHENSAIKDAYATFFKDKKNREDFLHTHFYQRGKSSQQEIIDSRKSLIIDTK